MATNFFSDFPALSYSLDDNSTRQVVTDIFRRIVLTEEFKNNSSYFEKYEVLHSETPEELSFRFYGTTELHWLILMVNDVIDPRFDWPQSEENLFNITSKKYGGDDNVFVVNRALDRKGYQTETFFLLTEDSTHKKPIRLLYEPSPDNPIRQPIPYATSEKINQFESNYEVEQKLNEERRTLKILKPEIVDQIVTNYKNLLQQ